MSQSKTSAIVVAVLTGTVFLVPSLQARTCSGTGDIIGSYAFLGSRAGFFLLGATPPGTATTGSTGGIGVTAPGSTAVSGPLIPVAVTPAGTTSAFNTTNTWSRFINNLSGRAAFSSVGRVFFDGLGNIFFTDPAALFPTNALAGTYLVNSDCSVTMSIRDPFPATTGGALTTTGGPTITLEGEIIDGRVELVSTNPNAAGATITLVKTAQFNACANSSLTGSYGFVGSGVVVPGATLPVNALVGGLFPTGTLGGAGSAFGQGTLTTLGTPFNLLGRAFADGNGNFINDALGTASPVKRILLGTYNIGLDCTGTASLIDAASGATRNIGFVLVNDLPSPAAGGTVTIFTQPALRFAFTDPGVFGGGSATMQ